MDTKQSLLSNAFQSFLNEAPRQAGAWMEMVQGVGKASALDKKTEELAYLAVLAAVKMESGIPFHVQSAKKSRCLT